MMLNSPAAKDSLEVPSRKRLTDPPKRFNRCDLPRMERSRHEAVPLKIFRGALAVAFRHSADRVEVRSGFDYFDVCKRNSLEGEERVC